MLGSDLVAACRDKGIDVAVFDLPEFDITDEKQLAGACKDAKVIINCAAYTNVEKAESERRAAMEINGAAVGRLGRIARKLDSWVLHISTDFVFDGTKNTPYVETDAPNPISAYGKSKLEGEELLEESGCRKCIMRLEWTYGRAGNNFVKKLVSIAGSTGQLKVVDDQIGSPTATTEAAKAVCGLLSKKPEGIFHFAASGFVSRFDMARFIIDKLCINAELSRCKSSDYKTAAQRPLNSRFDCSKIRRILDKPIRPWEEPLEEFLVTGNW